MSKTDHFRMISAIILITVFFSITGLIQGLDILTFMVLGIVGIYFSFFFIKYANKQKDNSISEIDENLQD